MAESRGSQDEEDGRRRKRQRQSKVWDHFKLKTGKKDAVVECVQCKAELAYHNSTSSMLQHLNRKHPTWTLPDTLLETRSQRTMQSFLTMRPSCTKGQAAEFTDCILKMFVGDMRPICMVEDKGFKQMVATFNPQYVLPSRTYFTKMMEKKYTEIKAKLKDTLNETETVALTTDIWTSVAVEAYMGVTCHCIDENWEMQSFSLTTLPLEDRHTAVNIAEWLGEVIDKFGIPPQKVKAVVHDNGANVVAAVRLLAEKHGWASVKCAAHTLNLIVQNTLKNNNSLSKCVSAARCLVEHFKKSELAGTKLKEKQLQMGTPEHMLIQDVSTRWNSTFYMLSRLLEQRWPVTATLSDPTVTPKGKSSHLDLKPEQWSLAEELRQALAPFEGATVFLSGQQYVTLSTLPQLVYTLKKTTEGSDYEAAPVKACQTRMAEEIKSRWGDIFVFNQERPNTILLAAALDPRFRRLKFLPSEDIFKVQSTVQTMALEIKKSMQTIQTRNDPYTTVQEDNMVCSKKETFLDKVLGSSTDSSASDDEDPDGQVNQMVQTEVLMYFGEQPLPKKENPLIWWKTNEGRYPTLAKLAKSFLCIPATSTPSEQLFSAAGNIVSNRRASLSSEHVDMLTFLHCNSHMLFET